MPSLVPSLMFLAPAALVGVAVTAFSRPGQRPAQVLRASRLVTVGALLLAVASALYVALAGPATSATIGVAGFGLSIRLDALSVVMFLLVSFVGAIVVRYSHHYLDGDERQGAFTGGLCLTLAAVTLLVLAGNLVQLVLAWMATSLSLHRLLLFYPERVSAAIAARKKFVTARAGDACLIGAALLLGSAFGTGDIASILAAARDVGAGPTPSGVVLATLLITIAALLKCAQFPFHGWLPEVMETPTPVSALLHAGIINAGGFLVIRFADVMLLSMPSLHLLAIVGGFTALFGGVVMLTQTSIKGSLAWSTVAQMGFMLLQCGLGVFALAVLHIVAHSLYKAHAFLSSGSVVDIARSAWVPDLDAPADPGARTLLRVGVAFGLSLALYLVVGRVSMAVSGSSVPEAAAVLTQGAILIMGLTLLIAPSLQGAPAASVIGRTVLAAGLVTVAWFALHAMAVRLMSSTLPATPAPDGLGLAIMMLAVVSFALVTALQVIAPARSRSPAWQAARVHLANGLYANALFDRLVGSARRVPVGAPMHGQVPGQVPGQVHGPMNGPMNGRVNRAAAPPVDRS